MSTVRRAAGSCVRPLYVSLLTVHYSRFCGTEPLLRTWRSLSDSEAPLEHEGSTRSSQDPASGEYADPNDCISFRRYLFLLILYSQQLLFVILVILTVC
jgi:hypothetical protein